MSSQQCRFSASLIGSVRQRGVVMAIALSMLLLLTIIGVTTMSTGNLQEIMARNMLDRNYAFQSGESALRDAEIDIENNLTSGAIFDSSCSNGLCLPPPASVTTPIWETVDWGDDHLTRDFGEHTGSDASALGDKLNAIPRYIIEYNNVACDPSVPGEELGKVVKFDKYRITTTATGRSDKARVRLQTTYRKRNGYC